MLAVVRLITQTNTQCVSTVLVLGEPLEVSVAVGSGSSGSTPLSL